MNYCYFRVSGLVSTLENACTPFCTHNAVKIAFKLRNFSNGREITHNFRQNRPMVAICVCLGVFRRWETRGLRSARIMQWKYRLNDEISQTGEKLRIIVVKIDELLLFACVRVCFVDRKRVPCVLHAVRGALKRRSISNGREITHNYCQNRRTIAICVCLGLFRRRKSRALRSARIMQLKDRLNAEIY